jgi:hypothetical protein
MKLEDIVLCDTQEYRTKVACNVCNAEVLKGMLPEHMATQHFNSVWTCKKCGRKWRTSTHYYIHISRPCRQIEDLETGNGDNELCFLPDSDNENMNIVLSSTALARISADIEAGIEKSAYGALGRKESITELREMIKGILSILSIDSAPLCSGQMLTNKTRRAKFDELGGAFTYHRFDKMTYCVFNPPNCELIDFGKPVAESRQH